jgi:hypothetical protein
MSWALIILVYFLVFTRFCSFCPAKVREIGKKRNNFRYKKNYLLLILEKVPNFAARL